MRKSLTGIAAVLLLAACSTSNNSKVNIPQPDVQLEQLSSAPVVAAHVTGGIPINLRLSVTNNAKIPITIKRINVTSQGSGGYNVPNASRPFDKAIAAGETWTTAFWVPGYADA